MKSLIDRHQLEPHPEGGFYRETYRSATQASGRSLCTAILYLLPAGQFSALHRIDADELWHFYEGDPLLIVELQTGKPARQTLLSRENPQHLVPARTWFGAVPAETSQFAFVGCTVAPAFQFATFELGQRETLSAEFVQARAIIERLTRVVAG